MQITVTLISALLDVSKKLTNNNINFCLTGGLAAGMWGTPLPIISIEDLLILKMTSNRTQDRFDVENILSSGKTVDFAYIKNTITAYDIHIKMRDIFEKIL